MQELAVEEAATRAADQARSARTRTASARTWPNSTAHSDVYKNYVKKFSDQESEIEKARGQIASLNDQAAGMQKSLDEYMMGLDVQ